MTHVLTSGDISVFSLEISNQRCIKKYRLTDLSLQKGFMVKLPGCWEHTSLVWKELNPAKTKKLNLAEVWLDIANAYGSVPHQLIFFALERFSIDPIWDDLLKSYYVGLWNKSFSPTAPYSWHKH